MADDDAEARRGLQQAQARSERTEKLKTLQEQSTSKKAKTEHSSTADTHMRDFNSRSSTNAHDGQDHSAHEFLP